LRSSVHRLSVLSLHDALPISFTGEPGYHQGIDISTEKGQPVYATADGTVEAASYTGDYGNLIVLRHGFGLATRYGHLSSLNAKRSEEHTSELQSRVDLVCRLL